MNTTNQSQKRFTGRIGAGIVWFGITFVLVVTRVQTGHMDALEGMLSILGVLTVAELVLDKPPNGFDSATFMWFLVSIASLLSPLGGAPVLDSVFLLIASLATVFLLLLERIVFPNQR